jgi:hypothetical protein
MEASSVPKQSAVLDGPTTQRMLHNAVWRLPLWSLLTEHLAIVPPKVKGKEEANSAAAFTEAFASNAREVALRSSMSQDAKSKIVDILQSLEYASKMDRELQKLADIKDEQNILAEIRKHLCGMREKIVQLQPGGAVVMLGGFGLSTKSAQGNFNPMVYCVEKQPDSTFTFTVCNCRGQTTREYHPLSTSDYPRFKYRTAFCVPNIPAARMADPTVWWMILTLKIRPEKYGSTSKVLYDVLLPWLAQCTLGELPEPEPQNQQQALYETIPEDDNLETDPMPFRCVITAFRYMALTRLQNTQCFCLSSLMLSLRVAMIRRAAVDVEQCSGSLWDSDVQIIQAGCRSVAVYAARGGISDSVQAEVAEVVELLQQKLDSVRLQIGSPEECPTPLHDTAVQDGGAAPFVVEYSPFSGFGLVAALGSSTEQFAGGLSKGSPDVFIDLSAGAGEVEAGEAGGRNVSFAYLVKRVKACSDLCDRLRAKSSVSPASIAVHQICATVEHTFTSELPRPLPFEECTASSFKCNRQCPWACKGDRPDTNTQLQVLRALHSVATHYSSAAQSFPSPPEQDTVRIITMSTIVACFDATLRMQLKSGATELLLARLCKAEDPTLATELEQAVQPFYLSSDSFHGARLTYILQTTPLRDPLMLSARREVIAYFRTFERRPDEESIGSVGGGMDWKRLISWVPGERTSDGGDADGDASGMRTASDKKEAEKENVFQPEYTDSQGGNRDATLTLVGHLLLLLDMEADDAPDLGLDANGGGGKKGGKDSAKKPMTKQERYTRFAGSDWERCPELVLLRDLMVLFKVNLQPGSSMKRVNEWYLTDRIRYTNHTSFKYTMTKDGNSNKKPLLLRISPRRAEPPLFHLQMKQYKGRKPEQGDYVPLSRRLALWWEKGLLEKDAEEGKKDEDPKKEMESEQRAFLESRLTPLEEDVMHLKQLPTDELKLSKEDTEKLLCMLTSPSLRIPLVMDFFAQDRVGALMNDELWSLLVSVVFESGLWRPKDSGGGAGAAATAGGRRKSAITAVLDAVAAPTKVPFDSSERAAHLTTPCGHLYHDLVHTPAATLSPLIGICQGVADLCIGGDYKSSFVQLFCKVVRLATDFERFLILAQQQPGLAGAGPTKVVKCDEQKKLRQFLRCNAVDFMQACTLQAKADSNIPYSLQFRSLLALLHANTVQVEELGHRQRIESARASGSVLVQHSHARALSDFLCSSAFVVSWHSKVEDPHADAGGAALAAVHSVFYAVERRRGGIMGVIEGQNLEQHHLEELLEAMSMATQEQTDLLTGAEVVEEGDDAGTGDNDGIGDDDTSLSNGNSSSKLVRNISCWRPVPNQTRECERVLSSPHPYPFCTDVYEEIHFPGADFLCISFDARTCTEKDNDYISFFKDHTHTSCWGSPRYSGNINQSWPGVNGQKPLVIPADHCVFHFHSDVGGEDWGYSLRVTGPVSHAAAQRLRSKLVVEHKDLTVQTCMGALQTTQNNVAEAETYLRSSAAQLQKETDEANYTATVVKGVYQDQARGLQVNLQTAEVYLNSSMLMSLPPDIRQHIETKSVFGDVAALYCTSLANNEHRRLLAVQYRGMSYQIAAWTTIKAQSEAQLNATKDRMRLEVLQKHATTNDDTPGGGGGVSYYASDSDCDDCSAEEVEVVLPPAVVTAARVLQSFLSLLANATHMQLTREQRQQVVERMYHEGFDSFDSLLVLREQDLTDVLNGLAQAHGSSTSLSTAIKPAHLRLIVLHARRLAVRCREDSRTPGFGVGDGFQHEGGENGNIVMAADNARLRAEAAAKSEEQQQICRWILNIEDPDDKWVQEAAAKADKPITYAWVRKMLSFTCLVAAAEEPTEAAKEAAATAVSDSLTASADGPSKYRRIPAFYAKKPIRNVIWDGAPDTARVGEQHSMAAKLASVLASIKAAGGELEPAAEVFFDEGGSEDLLVLVSGNKWSFRGLDKVGAINYPYQTDDGLYFCSSLYESVEWGDVQSTATWAIDMLREYWELLSDQLSIDGADRPSLWVWQGSGARPFAELLMYQRPLGDRGITEHHPGMLYEVMKVPHRDVLHIYSLWDHARTYQRQLAWTSDLSVCYVDLSCQTDLNQKTRRRAGLEFAAGNSLFGIHAFKGKSPFDEQSVQAAQWHRHPCGSIDVRRYRHLQRVAFERQHHCRLVVDAAALKTMGDERSYEELVPHKFLHGLLPHALLEGFVFWRTGRWSLRGYPFVNASKLAKLDTMKPEKRKALLNKRGEPYWKGRSLFVHLRPTSSSTDMTAYSTVVGTVYHLPSPDFEHAFDGEIAMPSEAQMRCLVLLDSMKAPADTALFRIVERLRPMELLAHILVWSRAQPMAASEQCPIAEVEMPRLGSGGLVFEVVGKKLKCKQYAGWFISERFKEPACRRLQGGARRCLWLENGAGSLSLLVPGFNLATYHINDCQLTSVHTIHPENPAHSQDKMTFWEEHAGKFRTPLYLYAVHCSLVFLEPPDLESKLYLGYLRLVCSDFEGSFRVLASCFSDTPFTKKQTLWIQKMVELGITNQNSLGCRLMIGLMFIEGGQKPSDVGLEVRKDYAKYLQNISLISAACRLTQADEKVIATSTKQKQRLEFINACTKRGAHEDSRGGSSSTLRLELTEHQKFHLKPKNGGSYVVEFQSKAKSVISEVQKLYDFQQGSDVAAPPDAPKNARPKVLTEEDEDEDDGKENHESDVQGVKKTAEAVSKKGDEVAIEVAAVSKVVEEWEKYNDVEAKYAVTHESITLEWEKSRGDGGASLLGYCVEAKRVNEGSERGWQGLFWDDRYYIVPLESEVKADHSPLSPNSTQLRLSQVVPESPQLTNKNDKHSKNKVPNKKFAIKCLWSTETELMIHGLQPATAYEFRVAACNRVGRSEFTVTKPITTKREDAKKKDEKKDEKKKKGGDDEEKEECGVIEMPFVKYRKRKTDLPFERLYDYKRPKGALEKVPAMKAAQMLFASEWPSKFSAWCCIYELMIGKWSLDLLQGEHGSAVAEGEEDEESQPKGNMGKKHDPAVKGSITCGHCHFERLLPSMLECPECQCVNYFFDAGFKLPEPDLYSKLDDAEGMARASSIPETTLNFADLALRYLVVNGEPFFEMFPMKYRVELSCLCVFLHTLTQSRSHALAQTFQLTTSPASRGTSLLTIPISIHRDMLSLRLVPSATGHPHMRSIKRKYWVGHTTTSPGSLRDWLLEVIETAAKLLHCDTNSWRAEEACEQMLQLCPKEEMPDPQVSIGDDTWLPSRPVMPDCKRSSIDLSVLELPGSPNLSLDSTQATSFAQCPLDKLMGRFTQQQLDGAQDESLYLDLRELQKMAKSKYGRIAEKIVARLDKDVKLSQEKAKKSELYELKCFPFIKFEMLGLAFGRSTKAKQEANKVLQQGIGDLGLMMGDLLALQADEKKRLAAALLELESVANSGSESDSRTSALSQVGGLRVKLWFELIAAAFVSQEGSVQLEALNPSLKGQSGLFEALAGIMFRTVKISQASMCVGLTAELIDYCKTLLVNDLLLMFLAKEEGMTARMPTKRMVVAALDAGEYDAVKAGETLKKWLEKEAEWCNEMAGEEIRGNGRLQKKLSSVDDLTIVASVHEYTGFDAAATTALLADLEQVNTLLDLASRGCCMHGKLPLRMLTAADEDEEAWGATKSRLVTERNAVLYVAQQTAAALVSGLRAHRAYVRPDNTYDPRFLLFEFMLGFMLRGSQYEVIAEFLKDATHSDRSGSSVRQMIMGAGKTTVIAPMLALLLADGNGLVMQVVPDALLEMSRSVMSKAFATCLPKRVYTMTFSRPKPGANTTRALTNLLNKLQRAQRQMAIVVTTPGNVKSLYLHYIDLLTQVAAAPKLLMVQPSKLTNALEQHLEGISEEESNKFAGQVTEQAKRLHALEAEAEAAQKVLQLVRANATALIDEVDWVLHPLTSELNFPIGDAKALELTKGCTMKFPLREKEVKFHAGARWRLPMHLLDAIHFASCGQSVLQLGGFDWGIKGGGEVLDKIKEAVSVTGQRCMAVQQKPHIVLMEKSFYNSHMKPLLAEWAVLWLKEQVPIAETIKKYACKRKPHHSERRPSRFPVPLKTYITTKELVRSEPPSESSGNERIYKAMEDYIQNRNYEEAAACVKAHFLGDCVPSSSSSGDAEEPPPEAMQLLNLARNWITSFVPHCLGKRNRVEYGLLTKEDIIRFKKRGQDKKEEEEEDEEEEMKEEAALALKDASSRELLAVPFMGKDSPSPSAEFSLPEVQIGMSILAYQYEGLREHDIRIIVEKLKRDFKNENGPPQLRASWVLFESWKTRAKDKLTGLMAQELVAGDGGHKSDVEAAKMEEEKKAGLLEKLSTVNGLLPLELFQPYDDKQIVQLGDAIASLPIVSCYYMDQIVFPKTMKFRMNKLSASGMDLGSNMIFKRRLGFSGTPSNMLPRELQPCHFADGDDAAVVKTLSSTAMVNATVFDPGWTPESLLLWIATSKSPPFSALIDTGALITGYTNEECAREMLKIGLTAFKGCVFLDPDDKKMVVTRVGGPSVSLESCGLGRTERFTFYDQVHTTGMDIKQTIDATAALTLGKGMTLRDYAQGAWRMRGLGKGQTIHLLIVPEIGMQITKVMAEQQLPPGRLPAMNSSGQTREQAAEADTIPTFQAPRVCLVQADGTRRMELESAFNQGFMKCTPCILTDVITWLLLNGTNSEKLQHAQLCAQTVDNVYRVRAFEDLLGSTTAEQPQAEVAEPDEEGVRASRSWLNTRFVGDPDSANSSQVKRSRVLSIPANRSLLQNKLVLEEEKQLFSAYILKNSSTENEKAATCKLTPAEALTRIANFIKHYGESFPLPKNSWYRDTGEYMMYGMWYLHEMKTSHESGAYDDEDGPEQLEKAMASFCQVRKPPC